jgi:predicted nuclease of predicted toxin-antitoxin system
MKLLLDECIDERLRLSFSEYTCETARFAGFAGLKNGELLDAAEAAGFGVLITVDQNMPNQQNLRGRKLSILILCAVTNRLRDLAVLVPEAKDALSTIGCGATVVIGFQVP